MQKGLYCVKVCSKRVFSLILSFCYVFCCCGFLYCFGVEEGVTSKSNPKLSVVVPVYNVAPYLDEALDSVENQTYKDMEVICVNDGSTDNSPEILERHAKKDKRIKIITQKNQGAGEARNVGLRAAVGDYLYFFDPDDVIVPYAMEKAVANLEKYDADAAEFAYTEIDCKDHVDLSKHFYKEKPVKVIECDGALENPIQKFGNWPVMVWTRVCKRSFLIDNNIYFKKELRTNEDILFNYFLKAHMRKLVKDSNVCYFYRLRRPGSIMNSDYLILNKRAEGYLAIIQELMLNKDKFKFPGGKAYLVSITTHLMQGVLRLMDVQTDRAKYARRAYEEIWTNFAQKYNVKISKESKKELDYLKKLATEKPTDKKGKRANAKKQVVRSKKKAKKVAAKKQYGGTKRKVKK